MSSKNNTDDEKYLHFIGCPYCGVFMKDDPYMKMTTGLLLCHRCKKSHWEPMCVYCQAFFKPPPEYLCFFCNGNDTFVAHPKVLIHYYCKCSPKNIPELRPPIPKKLRQ